MYKRFLILITLILMLSFSFATLDDGLISYYNLDETSGTSFTDSTGSNDGTGNNTDVSGGTGIINDGGNFDTGNYDIDLGTGINLFDNNNDFSVGFWLNPTTFVLNGSFINLGTGRDNGFYLQDPAGDGSFQAFFSNSSAKRAYYRWNTVFSTGSYQYVVFARTGNTTKLYVNGVDQGAPDSSGNDGTSPFPITYDASEVGFIGADNSETLFIDANLDEIGLWNRYLSQAEVTELYNSGDGLTYPFDGSVIADFNYSIDFETELVSLTDNSSVFGALEITDWNWLKDGNVLSTDQNTSFSITPNTNYNICLTVDTNDVLTDSICKTIEVSGELRLNFYDDDTNNSLDEMYLEFNGTPYYSDSNTFIKVGLETITNGNQSILLQRTGYQEKSFDLNLNKFTDYNYDLGFILSSKISTVQFQVFNELGATQPNTTFMAIDNYNGFIIDFETTDSLGRVTFILNNQKEDYNFYSDDLNFGTTTWTINKPKDAITLAEISGDWKYSITGNSYSSQTNIASGITKLLLQNTVNPYYMSIQDVNEEYVETTFGLISITSEKTKTLTPYLYGLNDAELRLIKLYDYATNQPISRQIQLDLSLYTDSNGLIPIGSFINDSTGTYNIYLDSNSNYRLELESEVFELNPSELINLYHIYLQTDVGITEPVIVGDVNIPLNDLNFPTTFFTDVSDYAFGCNINDDANCYAPTVFSLIASVLLLIVFVAFLQTTPIQQTIASGIILTLFTLISFIPIWVFAITLVIIIAWGLFT